MKLSTIILTAASAFTFLLCSCRKESDDILSGNIYTTDGYYNMMNSYPRSYEEMFRTLWVGMNCNYAAWDIETVDWDSVYHVCLPVVRSWDEDIVCGRDTVGTDVMKAFFTEMFSGIRDGHFRVKIWDMIRDVSFSVSPSADRLMQRPDYHSAALWFNEKEYYREILKDSTVAVSDSVSPSVCSSLKKYSDQGFFSSPVQMAVSPDEHMCVMTGVIGGTIPYMRFSSFEFCTSFIQEQSLTKNRRNVSSAYQSWFKNIQHMTFDNSLDGVIVDVRGNSGGLVDDFRYIVGSLVTDSVIEVGKYRRKDGLGRLDFGPAVPMRLPCRNTVHYSVVNRPIVILTDCNSGSMAEITAYCSMLKDNIFTVGECTYGATSMLDNSYEATYSGSFGDREHGPYFVYLPSGLFIPSVGPLLEGTGVEPDFHVPFNQAQFNSTLQDNQLETAVSLIKSGLMD